MVNQTNAGLTPTSEIKKKNLFLITNLFRGLPWPMLSLGFSRVGEESLLLFLMCVSFISLEKVKLAYRGVENTTTRIITNTSSITSRLSIIYSGVMRAIKFGRYTRWVKLLQARAYPTTQGREQGKSHFSSQLNPPYLFIIVL